ncbi:MAG: PhoH family protein [Planctomycetota bacterium]
MEIRIELSGPEELMELFGSHDRNLKVFREHFPSVDVVARGGALKLMGPDADALEHAEAIMRRMLQRVRRGAGLDRDIVIEIMPAVSVDALGRVKAGAAFARPRGGGYGPNGGGADLAPLAAAPPRRIARPRTPGQAGYLRAIDDNSIVFSIGPAGTGKTFLAVSKAVERLRAGVIERIVLCRPAVEAGEKLGFLPGDFHAKVNPYLRPLYDSLNDLLERETVKRLVEQETIEVVPLAYMRGRTLNNAFIILDEAQNTTSAQMKMFLTRMGEGSYIVVTGDPSQVDLPPGKLSGLEHITRILPATDGIAFVRLNKCDIVRHPLVTKIVEAYERNDHR